MTKEEKGADRILSVTVENASLRYRNPDGCKMTGEWGHKVMQRNKERRDTRYRKEHSDKREKGYCIYVGSGVARVHA